MTKELEAGAELDAEVTRLLGTFWPGRMAYSINWTAAGLAIEAMRERGWWCEIKSPSLKGAEGADWWAGFTALGSSGWNGRADHKGSGVTGPLAICRAIVAALGAEQPSQPAGRWCAP